MILLRLFWAFLQVGCFSIGGGYAAMPLIQSQVVAANSWLTMNEFTDLVTIAEMTPGPIAVNAATFVGVRIAGIPGAVAATFGCITPSIVLVSLLAYVYYRYKNVSALQSVLSSLRPAVVALIASAGVSIFRTAMWSDHPITLEYVNLLALASFAVAFFLLRKCKWNPILVMLLCGVAGVVAQLLT